MIFTEEDYKKYLRNLESKRREMYPEVHIQCVKCNECKTKDEFHERKNGLDKTCKLCRYERAKICIKKRKKMEKSRERSWARMEREAYSQHITLKKLISAIKRNYKKDFPYHGRYYVIGPLIELIRKEFVGKYMDRNF